MKKSGKKSHKKDRSEKPRREARRTKRGENPHSELPSVAVLTIIGISEEGELIAEPAKWDPKRKAPHIVVTESGRQAAAVKGDRVLAKMRKVRPHLYQALVIRVLPNEQPQNVLGVFAATADGGIIEPITR